MKNLICLIIFLKSASAQSYADKCEKEIEYNNPCTILNFNDFNCFPWNQTFCTLETSYSNPCTYYDCKVNR